MPELRIQHRDRPVPLWASLLAVLMFVLFLWWMAAVRGGSHGALRSSAPASMVSE